MVATSVAVGTNSMFTFLSPETFIDYAGFSENPPWESAYEVDLMIDTVLSRMADIFTALDKGPLVQFHTDDGVEDSVLLKLIIDVIDEVGDLGFVFLSSEPDPKFKQPHNPYYHIIIDTSNIPKA